MDEWFPKLSPSGNRIACGSEIVKIADRSGIIEVGPGTGAQWLNEHELVYTKQPTGELVHWPSGKILRQHGFNELVARDGRWAGFRAAEGKITTSWDASISGRCPALSDRFLAYIDGTNVVSNGQIVGRGNIIDLKISPKGFPAWSQFENGRWETWGPTGSLHVNPEGQERWPVPIEDKNGIVWILSHTDRCLILRPVGSKQGYLVWEGVTDYPDIVAMDLEFRIVWSTFGNVTIHGILYSKPTIDLPSTLVPIPVPIPEPEPEPNMTPSEIVKIMQDSGREIDSRFPGLRSSNVESWMAKAAYLASISNAGIGRKSRGPGARVSPDTMGYSPDGNTSNFYAVSIIRDNPPVNEWRNPPLDYGMIYGQLWTKAEKVDIGETPPIPGPEPPPNPNLEARVQAIEDWIRRF